MSLEEALQRRAQRIRNIADECAPLWERSKNITFEIGCGKGHYLSAYAASFPEQTCVGIDLISERVRDSRRRAQNKGAQNAFFFKAEAMEFLEAMPRDAVLEKIFIFFPDPWPKERHHRRRLMQGDFLDYIRQFSRAGARMYFRTDYAEYFEWTLNTINQNSNWEIIADNSLPFEEVSQFQRILPDFSTLVAEAV